MTSLHLLWEIIRYQSLTSDWIHVFFEWMQSPPLLERFTALVIEALSVSMGCVLSRHVALASPERSSWTDGTNRAKWVSCGKPGGNGDNGLQELAGWLTGWLGASLAQSQVISFWHFKATELSGQAGQAFGFPDYSIMPVSVVALKGQRRCYPERYNRHLWWSLQKQQKTADILTVIRLTLYYQNKHTHRAGVGDCLSILVATGLTAGNCL